MSQSNPAPPDIDASSVRAVVFDVGGVLLVPKDRVRESDAESEEFRAYYKAIEDRFYHRLEGDHVWHKVEVGEISEDEFFEQLAEDYGKKRGSGRGSRISGAAARAMAWGSGLTWFPPMLEFARAIHDGGWKTAILSNAARGEFDDFSEFHDPMYFDIAVVSGDIGMRKPNPDIYEYTFRKLEVEAGECLYIDDHACNLDAASALGCQTLLCEDPEATLGLLLRAFAAGRDS